MLSSVSSSLKQYTLSHNGESSDFDDLLDDDDKMELESISQLELALKKKKIILENKILAKSILISKNLPVGLSNDSKCVKKNVFAKNVWTPIVLVIFKIAIPLFAFFMSKIRHKNR